MNEIIQNRLQIFQDSQKCMARIHHGAFAMPPSGIGVCRMHVRTWRKHCLMTDSFLSYSHEADLTKY